MKKCGKSENLIRRLRKSPERQRRFFPAAAAAAIIAAVWLFGAATSARALEVGLVDVDVLVNEHPAAKAMAEELKKTEMKRNEEFKKKAQEKFGVSELTDIDGLSQEKKTQFGQFMQMEKEKFEDEMTEKQAEALKIIEGDIVKVVRKIAKENKLDFVFNKRVVVFGGTDITKDAISELKKMK